MPVILYVDDDPPNLGAFVRSLDEDFTILTAPDGRTALQILANEPVGVLVSDQRMPEMTGIELLAEASRRWPTVRRVLLTAYSDREVLLDAIQRGHVHDYILKPWAADDVRLRLQRQLADFRERAAERAAREERQAVGLLGLEGGLSALGGVLDRIAATQSSVLIRGESGTGKELLARALHQRSPRAAGPFIRVNCAAFSEGVLESELFGHEAGAFTGARGGRAGRFEQADGGTLFLDEIGDLLGPVQVKLLRVLQERELERVGGNRTIRVDIRLITATHRDLDRMVQAGTFRSDLFFRLNVVPLTIPPLRERPQDLATLARHFLDELAGELGKRLTFSPAALATLASYDWPGNVRELRNVIERAVVLAEAQAILEPEDLVFDFGPPLTPVAPVGTIAETVAREEEARLRRALVDAGGKKARAARQLGLPRTTLVDRLRKYGIE